MRPLESYAIYLALYVSCHGILPATYYAAIALAIATIAQVVIEQPRWQLGVLYPQVAYLVYSVVFDGAPFGWLFLLFSIALLLATSALACLFPITKFPELNGPFQTVGVEERFFVTAPTLESRSAGRPRSGSVDLSVHPEMGVTVFYPSSTSKPTKQGAPFMSGAVAASLGPFLQMPSFLFSYLTLVRSRAVEKVPITSGEEKLPVIVFSHGLGGVANMYISQCAELASQGYCVFAPTHNDGSSCLAELTGTQVTYRPVPDEKAEPGAEVAMRASQLRTRARELEHVIDLLVAGESDGGAGWRTISTSPSTQPTWSGRLDLSRISLIGHSFGGATVVQAGGEDTRVKCVIAHDLWTQPLATQSPPSLNGIQHAPVMMTVSDQWYDWKGNMDVIDDLCRSSANALKVLFRGTRHSNYSDIPMFAQYMARRSAQIGKAEFKTAMLRINKVQTAFLAKHILGVKEEPKEVIAKTPEVAALP